LRDQGRARAEVPLPNATAAKPVLVTSSPIRRTTVPPRHPTRTVRAASGGRFGPIPGPPPSPTPTLDGSGKIVPNPPTAGRRKLERDRGRALRGDENGERIASAEARPTRKSAMPSSRTREA
jgi:hypothetical protein